MVRHSHQDALTETEYEKLIDATGTLRAPFDREALFILIAGGRLGMRAGEICHMRDDWINWDRSLIEIPSYQNCDCGYCRQQAQQSVEKTGVDFETAFSQFWSPKTDHSARAVPFDFSDRVDAVVRAFFDEFDCYEHSRSSVNRRVDRIAEAADMDPDTVYPHALRATAATYHSYRGLPAAALQSLMGWSNLDVAQKYIRLSGGATRDALKDVHSDD